MRRKAFTMIELIFVIVVIGIIAKFGVEFLIKAYDGYIFSAVQNKLQTQTEVALEQIANRLQYRIKPSIIARVDATNYVALANATGNETILEWIGYDIDGLRGDWNGSMNVPTWSGFIDLAGSTPPSTIVSPMTRDANITAMINALSGNPAIGVAQSAIFFIGGNSDITKFGWGGVITDQNQAMHPVTISGSNIASSVASDFSGVDIYEYYQLAWSAYALVWSGTNTSHSTAYTPALDGGAGSTSLFGTVLPTPLQAGTNNGQWREDANNTYTVKANNMDINFTYNPTDGSFTCTADNTPAGQICKRLTN